MSPDALARAAREVREQCIGTKVRMAARAVTQHYDEALAGTGIRSTQFSVLVALAQAPMIPLSKLAEVLVMDRTTLTRNLAPLLREGFVEERSADDRRVRCLALGEGGRDVLAKALPGWRAAQARLVRALSAQDREHLSRILAQTVRAAHDD
jgi:DNA-binding MarR family transcriptional regulator